MAKEPKNSTSTPTLAERVEALILKQKSIFTSVTDEINAAEELLAKIPVSETNGPKEQPLYWDAERKRIMWQEAQSSTGKPLAECKAMIRCRARSQLPQLCDAVISAAEAIRL